MKNVKCITLSTIYSMLLISCAFVCSAASMTDWEKNQEKVFKMAKEQDKFIVLFVGRSTCGICKSNYSIYTNPEWPVKQILDDNYIIWFSDFDNRSSQAEVANYTEEILKDAKTLPLVFVINPEEPEVIVKSYWGTQYVQQLQNFFTIDLLAGSALKWHEDREKVFNIATEQNRNIFKLTGRGTSGNCRQLIQQLNEAPLLKLLQQYFVLWYSTDLSEASLHTYAGDPNTLPYITILSSSEPDLLLDVLWGVQDVEALEAILKSIVVSNEMLASGNKVFVKGNVLHISNRIDNEQIQIFTLTGQHVASVRKNDYTFTVETSYFPKGMLIVTGSAGWSARVIVR